MCDLACNNFVKVTFMQATVAYYLMLDNRRRMSNGYLGSEFEEAKVSGTVKDWFISCSRFGKCLNSFFWYS